jgi:hypothetical protein
MLNNSSDVNRHNCGIVDLGSPRELLGKSPTIFPQLKGKSYESSKQFQKAITFSKKNSPASSTTKPEEKTKLKCAL